MCGRYAVVTKIEKIEKDFRLKPNKPDLFAPNPNIAAGEQAPIIVAQPKQLQLFTFGFTPHWAEKPTYVINARSEGNYNKENKADYLGNKGILKKPMFAKSIRSQRCLVPADAFIEGPEKEKLRKPYLIFRRDGAMMALAGIWESWTNPQDGATLHSFAIITTASNKLTQTIGHHRAPLVLEEEDYDRWLDPETPLPEITKIMRPFKPDGFNAYPISPAIKAAKMKALDVLQPTGPPVWKEYDYDVKIELALLGMGESPARKRKNKEDNGQLSLF